MKIQGQRSAFTLIEVLISIALLSLVLLALYQSVGLLRDSNRQLFGYLEKSASEKLGTQTLFLDILGSDGNITIQEDEFARLCLEHTINSLHELSMPKVCWVVAKEGNALLRIEGDGYQLPLISDDKAAVDEVMKDIDLFRVYRAKTDVLVLLRQKGKEPISFMVQSVPEMTQKSREDNSSNGQPKRVPPQRPSRPDIHPDDSGQPPAPNDAPNSMF